MKRCVFSRFPAGIAKFNNVWWFFFIPIQYAIEIAMWDCIWYDAAIFCVSEFQKKWANLRLPLNVQKQKAFQLQGGFAPLTPRPGALSLDPSLWGLRPQTPVIGSRSARSPWPPLPNPKYATGCYWGLFICTTLQWRKIRRAKVLSICRSCGISAPPKNATATEIPNAKVCTLDQTSTKLWKATKVNHGRLTKIIYLLHPQNPDNNTVYSVWQPVAGLA